MITPEENQKRIKCRNKAGDLRTRGKIISKPCLKCGSHKTEMHHPNYDEPTRIVWLCKRCHTMFHMEQIDSAYGKILLTDILSSATQCPRSAYFGSKRLVEASS